MKRNKLSIIMLAFTAALPFCAMASPLHVKPGAWETNATVLTTGMDKMIPPEKLQALPPEKRKLLEGGMPMNMTSKQCVKESDSIEDSFDKPKKDMKCERKNVKQTANSYEADVTCTKTNNKGKPVTFYTHIKVVAESAENVVATSDTQIENGPKSHMDMKSHWIAGSCAGISENPAMNSQLH